MGRAQKVCQQDATPKKPEVRKSQNELEISTVLAEMGHTAYAKHFLNTPNKRL